MCLRPLGVVLLETISRAWFGSATHGVVRQTARAESPSHYWGIKSPILISGRDPDTVRVAKLKALAAETFQGISNRFLKFPTSR